MDKKINNRKIGSVYEERAALFLEKKGYKIIQKNYYGKNGEIDIIASEGGYIVFVEVKYRKDSKNGLPESAVGFRKQKKLADTATAYLVEKMGSIDIPCRFDIVAFNGKQIHLIKNAFEIGE